MKGKTSIQNHYANQVNKSVGNKIKKEKSLKDSDGKVSDIITFSLKKNIATVKNQIKDRTIYKQRILQSFLGIRMIFVLFNIDFVNIFTKIYQKYILIKNLIKPEQLF